MLQLLISRVRHCDSRARAHVSLSPKFLSRGNETRGSRASSSRFVRPGFTIPGEIDCIKKKKKKKKIQTFQASRARSRYDHPRLPRYQFRSKESLAATVRVFSFFRPPARKVMKSSLSFSLSLSLSVSLKARRERLDLYFLRGELIKLDEDTEKVDRESKAGERKEIRLTH